MRWTNARSACSNMIAALVLPAFLAPAAALATGIAFLPGATRDTAVKSAPSLDLLTWTLPGGLLVADRAGSAGRTRVGTALPATQADAEWFLARVGRPSPRRADRSALARFGRVHAAGPEAVVIEVPRARLAAFFAQGFPVQHIPLDAPPAVARGAAPVPLAVAQVDTALKRAFVNTLSQSAFNQLIQEISGYATFFYNGSLRSVTTRSIGTAGHGLAADYLAAKLAGFGYTVAFDTFMVNTTTCRNIVATKPGLGAPAEYVVVGGHYDSTSPSPATTAPGAEDNGSGTSMVVEIARICAHRAFDRSIQFVLFDAEEQGLYGGQHFVADAVAQGRYIHGAIIDDMVGYYATTFGLHIEGQNAWESLMSTMAANVAKFTTCSYVKDYYSWGSDHVPFQQAGYPAFLAIDYDYEGYPFYHQTGDTWGRIRTTAILGIQIGRAAAATLADEAGLRPDLTGAPVPPPPAPRLAAWPNPFNPRVTVAFNLATDSRGEVAVFDLAGRRLATLASGALAAGERRITWDGRDDRGRQVPSGVYLCRLRTASETASLKLNLAR